VFLPVDFHPGNAQPTPRKETKILFYGDSITQSAYIPTPSLSWFVPAAETLGGGYLNRGIGSMVFDRDSLPAEADCRPEMIFIEYGGNDLGKTPGNDTALAAAEAWLDRLCVLYPDAEKYTILPDFFPEESEAILRRLDEYCRELTGLCLARGITVFSGKPLIPALPALFCGDHVHFNEAGSAVFANRLLNAVRLSRS
jgi:lysophospholipase L1-like esterase